MAVSGSVVVDASLVLKWLVEEDDSDRAHAALRSWVARDITRIAPYLMPFEVANALHRRTVRGELTVSDSTRLIARLLESHLELRPAAGPSSPSAAARTPPQPGRRLRCPLPRAGRERQLRGVDGRREALPGGEAARRQHAVDRRARSTCVRTGRGLDPRKRAAIQPDPLGEGGLRELVGSPRNRDSGPLPQTSPGD